MSFLVKTGCVIVEETAKGLKIWSGSGSGGKPNSRVDPDDNCHESGHIHVNSGSGGGSGSDDVVIQIASEVGKFMLGTLPYLNSTYFKDFNKYDFKGYSVVSSNDLYSIDEFSEKGEVGGLERLIKNEM
ncbi:MAG: hypothetical protein ACOCRX_07330 [Candidatus Woesearchaeota archaeon]